MSTSGGSPSLRMQCLWSSANLANCCTVLRILLASFLVFTLSPERSPMGDVKSCIMISSTRRAVSRLSRALLYPEDSFSRIAIFLSVTVCCTSRIPRDVLIVALVRALSSKCLHFYTRFSFTWTFRCRSSTIFKRLPWIDAPSSDIFDRSFR